MITINDEPLPMGCLDALSEYLATVELDEELDDLEAEALERIEQICSR